MSDSGGAAAEEDRLLFTLTADLRSERDRLASLEAEVARLRAELARTHEALAEADRAARCDALTGLPNRRAFDSFAQRALARHEVAPGTLALFFIDLDGFKPVNDRLGHAVGDELLRLVAERLVNAVRGADLVCRLAGDEFVCVLPNLQSPTHAQSIAHKLLRVIAQPCRIGPDIVGVGASIGIALYPRDGDDVAQLFRRADEAMYRAKSLGSGLAMARHPLTRRRLPPAGDDRHA